MVEVLPNSLREQLIEQKITKQVTVTGNSTGSVSIPIPRDANVFLKGYGYTWYSNCVFQISTGLTSFPTRTDQEGSPSIPVNYGTPFKCQPGGNLQLFITNNSGSNLVFDVVFYVLTSEILNVTNQGNDLQLNTGGDILGYQIGASPADLIIIQNSTEYVSVGLTTSYQTVAQIALTRIMQISDVPIRIEFTINANTAGTANIQGRIYRSRNGVETALGSEASDSGGGGNTTLSQDLSGWNTGDIILLKVKQPDGDGVGGPTSYGWRQFKVQGEFITPANQYFQPTAYFSN